MAPPRCAFLRPPPQLPPAPCHPPPPFLYSIVHHPAVELPWRPPIPLVWPDPPAGPEARLLAALAEGARRGVALPVLVVDVDGVPRVLDGAPADADLGARVVVPLAEVPAIPRVREKVLPVTTMGGEGREQAGGRQGGGGGTDGNRRHKVEDKSQHLESCRPRLQRYPLVLARTPRPLPSYPNKEKQKLGKKHDYRRCRTYPSGKTLGISTHCW